MPSLAADPENGENVLADPAETLGAERQGDPALQGDRLVEPPAIPVQKQPDVRRAGLAQHVGEQPLPVDQPGLRIMPGADLLLLVAPTLNPGFPPALAAQAGLLPLVRPAAALQESRLALEGPQGCAAVAVPGGGEQEPLTGLQLSFQGGIALGFQRTAVTVHDPGQDADMGRALQDGAYKETHVNAG